MAAYMRETSINILIGSDLAALYRRNQPVLAHDTFANDRRSVMTSHAQAHNLIAESLSSLLRAMTANGRTTAGAFWEGPSGLRSAARTHAPDRICRPTHWPFRYCNSAARADCSATVR